MARKKTNDELKAELKEAKEEAGRLRKECGERGQRIETLELELAKWTS